MNGYGKMVTEFKDKQIIQDGQWKRNKFVGVEKEVIKEKEVEKIVEEEPAKNVEDEK